jgi:hypothetical protein
MPTTLRFFLGLALWLTAAAAAQAQDVIFDRNGHELTGQVLEITPTQVVYRPQDADAALPPAILDRQTLFMVRFANGTREVFGSAPAAPLPGSLPGQSAPNAAPSTLSTSELYRMGKRDALAYHNYSGTFWGTYAATALTGYGGVLVGIGTSLRRPRAERNMALDRALLRYPAYVDGYERQAQRRKIGEAAKGIGAGLGTVLVIIVALVAGA